MHSNLSSSNGWSVLQFWTQVALQASSSAALSRYWWASISLIWACYMMLSKVVVTRCITYSRTSKSLSIWIYVYRCLMYLSGKTLASSVSMLCWDDKVLALFSNFNSLPYNSLAICNCWSSSAWVRFLPIWIFSAIRVNVVLLILGGEAPNSSAPFSPLAPFFWAS